LGLIRGLILDTSVLVDTERKRQDIRITLQQVSSRTLQLQLAVSTVTLVELAHGVARSQDAVVRETRERFLADVRSQIPSIPVSDSIVVEAGLTAGNLRAQGIVVGLADLLIGMTALQSGDGVLTSNLRHFRMLPGLEVMEF